MKNPLLHHCINLILLSVLFGICVYHRDIYVSAPLKEIDFPAQGVSYPNYPQPLLAQALDPDYSELPVICNLQIVDIDQDGQNEILICDTQKHGVYLRHYSEGTWSESAIAENIKAPAHATLFDYDQDGDLDILVADLGDVFPNDGLVGSIYFLENRDGSFHQQQIIKDLGRVADVQCADFDGDGDTDLVVAVFGHGHGELIWLEQIQDGSLVKHQLLEGPGAIHAPCADFDKDGDIDIACVLSQDEEELWLFENNGSAVFANKLLFKSMNQDLGMAGLVTCDIDSDGDMDLLLPCGDNLEEFFHHPQTYHGCYLFTNEGNLEFAQKQISHLPGCYAATTGDFNRDGKMDIALVSMVNNWDDPKSASVVLLQQNEKNEFDTYQIAASPIGFITCALGDANNDGIPDIICGGFRIQPPYDRVSRIHLWTTKP